MRTIYQMRPLLHGGKRASQWNCLSTGLTFEDRARRACDMALRQLDVVAHNPVQGEAMHKVITTAILTAVGVDALIKRLHQAESDLFEIQQILAQAGLTPHAVECHPLPDLVADLVEQRDEASHPLRTEKIVGEYILRMLRGLKLKLGKATSR